MEKQDIHDLNYLRLDGNIACCKCIRDWVMIQDLKKQGIKLDLDRNMNKYNKGMYYTEHWALSDLIDTNLNNGELCKGCNGPLGNDRMIGGDGTTGCDVLPFRYHERCFYGRFGYFD